ncbi:hypothetical protein [Dysgonomonas sp. PH5-45]|nr:hypothetical protein [Dysgonomonas sp. PH5-45]
MKIFLKIMKIVIVITILLVLTVSIILQIKFERSISEQKKENGLLKGRERIKWTPAVIYILSSNSHYEEIDLEAFHLPYYEIGGYKNVKVLPINDVQKYILHCYYTKEEKIKYVDDVKKGEISEKERL